MTSDQYRLILADMVRRKVLSLAEATVLFERFESGDIAPDDLPLLAAELPEDDEDGAEILLFLLLLLGIRQQAARLNLRQRERLRTMLQGQLDKELTESIRQLSAGAISLRAWQRQGAKLLQSYARRQYAAGTGQIINTDKSQGDQLDYFARFAFDIHARQNVDRPLSVEQMTARGILYGGLGYGLWFLGNEMFGASYGWVVEYIARDDRKTCPACYDAARRSPYLPQHGPYPGQICYGRGRCRCQRRLVYDEAAYRRLVRI